MGAVHSEAWFLFWQTQWKSAPNILTENTNLCLPPWKGGGGKCFTAAALWPERRVIVRFCLRYKHRRASKGSAPRDLSVTICLFESACASARTYCMSLHLCVSVFYELMSRGVLQIQTSPPFPPPVFASWSKPRLCHRSFWCRGEIGSVEVLISSSVQLHKGQASPSSWVQWAGALEVPCLQACLGILDAAARNTS